MYVDIEPLIITELRKVLHDGFAWSNILSPLEMENFGDSFLTNPVIATSYTEQESRYPFIAVYENSNNTMTDTKDSAGFQHCQISFRVEIFTDGDLRKTQARILTRVVDDVMTKYFGFSRDLIDEIPNYRNRSIYRQNLLYSGIVDSDFNIYGR